MRIKFTGHEEHLVGGFDDHDRRDQQGGVVDRVNGEDVPKQKPECDGGDFKQVGGNPDVSFVHELSVYSADHSALWRHGAILRSRRLIKLKLTKPMAASSMTVTNSFGLSQVSEESSSK